MNKLFFSSQNFYIFSFSSLNANFHPISPTEFYSNATYFMLEVSFIISLSFFPAKYVCTLKFYFFISCHLMLNVKISSELH